MINLGKKNVIGVGISVVDYEGALEQVVEAAKMRKPLKVTALAVHGVMTGVLDSMHRYRLNQMDLVMPDGQPVRWALNWLHGAGLSDRVYGPTFTLKMCEKAAQEDLKVYLYGSQETVLADFEKNLKEKYSGLQVVGSRPSLFRRSTDEEKAEIAKEIRESGANLVFVGLGCPRQEIWVHECTDMVGLPCIAVGAAFDFHAGNLSQAPIFMQKHGLEWFYRLIQEPRRLWQRYILLNPAYLAMLFTQLTGIRKFKDAGSPPENTENFA